MAPKGGPSLCRDPGSEFGITVLSSALFLKIACSVSIFTAQLSPLVGILVNPNVFGPTCDLRRLPARPVVPVVPFPLAGGRLVAALGPVTGPLAASGEEGCKATRQSRGSPSRQLCHGMARRQLEGEGGRALENGSDQSGGERTC